MRQYWVYIMAGCSRVLYIGMTNNIERRVAEHKAMRVQGFTKRYRVTRLVYWELFAQVWDAIEREKQIKAWRRSKKVELIEEENPLWEDLAARWYNH